MTKQQLQKEWQRITFEIKNKPKINTFYSLGIVRMRELLLLSQVELEKIETGENKKFHTELYQTTIKYYQSKNV